MFPFLHLTRAYPTSWALLLELLFHAEQILFSNSSMHIICTEVRPWQLKTRSVKMDMLSLLHIADIQLSWPILEPFSNDIERPVARDLLVLHR